MYYARYLCKKGEKNCTKYIHGMYKEKVQGGSKFGVQSSDIRVQGSRMVMMSLALGLSSLRCLKQLWTRDCSGWWKIMLSRRPRSSLAGNCPVSISIRRTPKLKISILGDCWLGSLASGAA